jgi:hypothetical protein
LPKKVTRYRDKKTGRYISKLEYLRNRPRSLRKRERWVKGTRKTKQSMLEKLLDQAGKKPVIVRKVYKSKKHRKSDHLEIIYVGHVIKQVKVNHRVYTRPKDIEALLPLINAADFENEQQENLALQEE